jgi:hypothetical protein
MQAEPRARIDSPRITRGALLTFQGHVPSSPQPFRIQIAGQQTSSVEEVGIFDEADASREDLLGIRCKTQSDELICWLRREGDAFRIIRVDPPYPSIFAVSPA